MLDDHTDYKNILFSHGLTGYASVDFLLKKLDDHTNILFSHGQTEYDSSDFLVKKLDDHTDHKHI